MTTDTNPDQNRVNRLGEGINLPPQATPRQEVAKRIREADEVQLASLGGLGAIALPGVLPQFQGPVGPNTPQAPALGFGLRMPEIHEMRGPPSTFLGRYQRQALQNGATVAQASAIGRQVAEYVDAHSLHGPNVFNRELERLSLIEGRPDHEAIAIARQRADAAQAQLDALIRNRANAAAQRPAAPPSASPNPAPPRPAENPAAAPARISPNLAPPQVAENPTAPARTVRRSAAASLPEAVRQQAFDQSLESVQRTQGANYQEQFGKAFHELSNLEEAAQRLPPQQRAEALQRFGERRLQLIGDVLGNETNILQSPAVSRWNAVRSRIQGILDTNPGLSRELRTALEAAKRANPQTIGQALSVLHDIGCRDRNILRVGFLNFFDDLGIDPTAGRRLVDLGAVGSAPVPVSTPAAPAVAPPRPVAAPSTSPTAAPRANNTSAPRVQRATPEPLPHYPQQTPLVEVPTTASGRFATMGRNLLQNVRSPLGAIALADLAVQADQVITDTQELIEATGYRDRLKNEIVGVLRNRCAEPNPSFRQEGPNRFVSISTGRPIDVSSIESMAPSRILLAAGQLARTSGSILFNLAMLAGAVSMAPGIAVGTMVYAFPRLFPSIMGEFTLGTAEEYERFINEIPQELYCFIPLPTLLGEQPDVTWGRLSSLGNNLSLGYSVDERGRKVAHDPNNFEGVHRMEIARTRLLQASSIPLLQGQPLAQTLLGQGEEYWQHVGPAQRDDLSISAGTPRGLEQIVGRGIQHSLRRRVFDGYVQAQARIVRHDLAVQELRKMLSADSTLGISDASSTEELRRAALSVVRRPGAPASLLSLVNHLRSPQQLSDDVTAIDFLGRQRFTGVQTTMQQFYERQNIHGQVLQAGLQGELPEYIQLPREVGNVTVGFRDDIENFNRNMTEQNALQQQWESFLRSRFNRDPVTNEWILTVDDQTVRARQIGGEWYYRSPEQVGWTWARRPPETGSPTAWRMQQHIMALATEPDRMRSLLEGHEFMGKQNATLQTINGETVYALSGNAQIRFSDRGLWGFRIGSNEWQENESLQTVFKELRGQQRTIQRQTERTPLQAQDMQTEGRDSILRMVQTLVKNRSVRIEEITEDGQSIIRTRWSDGPDGTQTWTIDYAFQNGVWKWRAPSWGQPENARLSGQPLDNWVIPANFFPAPPRASRFLRAVTEAHSDIINTLNALNRR